MMVGYWELTHETIFESFVSGRPMHLEEPDNVDGPGCIECGGHWMSVRFQPCVPQEEQHLEQPEEATEVPRND